MYPENFINFGVVTASKVLVQVSDTIEALVTGVPLVFINLITFVDVLKLKTVPEKTTWPYVIEFGLISV
jgi:hypothetical protein